MPIARLIALWHRSSTVMAVTFQATLPLALLLLSRCVSATTNIHRVEESSRVTPLIRRDSPQSVRLGPAGELVREQKKQTNSEAVSDMCTIAFAYGKKDANNCTSDKHHLIYEESMCIRAAAEANLTTNSHFSLHPIWFDKYPKGCFKAPCGENADGCFFFNSDGDAPESPKGFPVCTRPRYQNGKNNSNDGCSGAYKMIETLDECSAAGDCLGHCEGSQFNVGEPNMTNRMNYPHGCFIDTSADKGGCVYFNPVVADKKPTAPVGVQICRTPNELKLASSG